MDLVESAVAKAILWRDISPGHGGGTTSGDVNHREFIGRRQAFGTCFGSPTAGVDLEYDPDFAEMERAAVGEPERQVGDSIKEAIPPNWQMVERLAKNLATQTKDLRVAAYLVRAALANHGFPGFHAGVSLMRGYVENYWDTLHPLLDPDDDNDPTARINAIKSLVDPSTSLFLVRTATIIRSRSTGSFSLRDFWIAKGDQPPPANLTTVPTMAMIEGAVQDCSLDELQATATAVDQAIVAVKEIERIATGKVDSGNGPELSALVKDLQAIAKILTNWLGQRGVDAAQATTEVATADAGPTVVQSVTVAAVARRLQLVSRARSRTGAKRLNASIAFVSGSKRMSHQVRFRYY